MPQTHIPALLLAALITYLFIHLTRTILSPLRKIPGPKLSLFTPLYLIFQEFSSNRRMYIHQAHQKYGPVVRLGPNEVSFISLAAVREIYASGGSGYDKTEFYSLFMQFGTRLVDSFKTGEVLYVLITTRTMFSTLGKNDVSPLLARILNDRTHILYQHSRKKRCIAGQYANTNILRPEVIGGIQSLADAFVKKCDDAKGESIDAYVW
jgi:hypothetical protein